jgi:hypothetical protein
MTAQLWDELRWFHWVRCRAEKHAGNPQRLAVDELDY